MWRFPYLCSFLATDKFLHPLRATDMHRVEILVGNPLSPVRKGFIAKATIIRLATLDFTGFARAQFLHNAHLLSRSPGKENHALGIVKME